MMRSRIKSWWNRKRPAPVDIFTPLMQWGRLRTWLNAVLRRPELRQMRAQASQFYGPLLVKLGQSAAFQPSDRSGRFTHHILHCGLQPPIRYLEVGAFDGTTVAAVYTLLEGKVQITAIDPFVDYVELPGIDMNETFDRFRSNIERVGATNAVRVLRGRSVDHLPKLIDEGAQFDIIYIDGSHAIADVMVDAALCWSLLVRGGLMIFDDYWYRRVELGREFRPKLAIDAFVGAMAHEIEVVDVAAQVFVRKK